MYNLCILNIQKMVPSALQIKVGEVVKYYFADFVHTGLTPSPLTEQATNRGNPPFSPPFLKIVPWNDPRKRAENANFAKKKNSCCCCVPLSCLHPSTDKKLYWMTSLYEKGIAWKYMSSGLLNFLMFFFIVKCYDVFHFAPPQVLLLFDASKLLYCKPAASFNPSTASLHKKMF